MSNADIFGINIFVMTSFLFLYNKNVVALARH